MLPVSEDKTEKQLSYAAATISICIIFILLIIVAIYHDDVILPINNNNIYFSALINSYGNPNVYLVGFLILASFGILSNFILFTIKKNCYFRAVVKRIVELIYRCFMHAAVNIIRFANKMQIRTSLIIGICYLIATIISILVAIYIILPIEYWHRNIWALTVTPLITICSVYAIGYLSSNFTSYLNPVFTRNESDIGKLIGEIGKFTAIALIGSLIMLLPICAHLLEMPQHSSTISV